MKPATRWWVPNNMCNTFFYIFKKKYFFMTSQLQDTHSANLVSCHWWKLFAPWYWHCVFFRCEGAQRQLPGPVGVRQWHHRSNSTRVKGTQLSGILALLWGNAVMSPTKAVVHKNILLCIICFFGTACTTPLTVPVIGWRDEKWKASLYTHFSYRRRMTIVPYPNKL